MTGKNQTRTVITAQLMFSYICNIRDKLALLQTSYKRENGEVQVLNK